MFKQQIAPDNELLLAHERLELLSRATHDVIWDWNLVQQQVWWSEGLQSVFGYPKEEIKSDPDFWYDRIHPEDQEDILKNIQAVIEKGGVNWSGYYRFRRWDGTYAHVHDRGYTIQVNGKPIRMVGSMQDITEQIAAQQAREESEEQLRFALLSAGLGTWNLDPLNNKVVWDQRCKELFGFPQEEVVLYENVLNYMHPDDQARVSEAVALALSPDSKAPYDIRFRTVGALDKRIRWLHCKGQAYFDQAGNPYRFSGIAQDITNQLFDQERAHLADQRALIAIEGAGAGSFSVTLDNDEILHSPAFAKIITGEEQNTLDRGVFIKQVHPEDVMIRELAFQEASLSGKLNYQARFIWKDGSVHWVKIIAEYLFDSSGTAIALSGIVLDTTEQVQSEQNLRASEERYRQLADELEIRIRRRTNELKKANRELTISNGNLQQFAYAASHDMQEPLRKIQSFSSRLQQVSSGQLDSNARFMLDRIQDASSRMANMIEDLLAYSRLTVENSDFGNVSLNNIAAQVLSNLEISIQEQNASISIESLPEVIGHPHQLLQLLQNLISNAIKYRRPDQDPQITVRSRRAEPHELASFDNMLPDQPYVRIEVGDNGIGFDEIYLERIFQMFQRLHGRGQFSGSGIGLALCRKVAQNHHGHLTAESTLDKGSTFIIFLPAT